MKFGVKKLSKIIETKKYVFELRSRSDVPFSTLVDKCKQDRRQEEIISRTNKANLVDVTETERLIRIRNSYTTANPSSSKTK